MRTDIDASVAAIAKRGVDLRTMKVERDGVFISLAIFLTVIGSRPIAAAAIIERTAEKGKQLAARIIRPFGLVGKARKLGKPTIAINHAPFYFPL
jgi:hypothetical protein